MSLYITLREPGQIVCPACGEKIRLAEPAWEDSVNITHNLGKMAQELGVYYLLWRGADVTVASDMLEKLRAAILALETTPEEYHRYDAPNGWGKLEHFLKFLKTLEGMCREHPEAEVIISV
jgi:hypothetical protein